MLSAKEAADVINKWSIHAGFWNTGKNDTGHLKKSYQKGLMSFKNEKK